jgi:hypothetical protein
MHSHRLAARRQVTAGLAWAMGVAFTGCGKDESTGPTTGSIAVITTTTGNNLDPDGYTVSVDGGASQAIGINETQTISEVSGGSHSVELGGVAANCTVEGPHPRTVSVAGGAKSQVGFLVRCFTPPPGTIAFETNRTGDFEVFKMNADGTNPVNLTNNAASDTEPDWSPDGTKVAFVSDRDGNNEIYVMNADGSGQTRLTTNSESETGPEWSPDGTKIAFETHREVNVMNADGSGQVNLTSNAAFDGHPAWSPDGTKIAFHTSRTGDIGDYFIYVMNPDGSNPVELSGILARSDRGPAWSPRGVEDRLRPQPGRELRDLRHVLRRERRNPAHPRNRSRLGSGVVARWRLPGVPERPRREYRGLHHGQRRQQAGQLYQQRRHRLSSHVDRDRPVTSPPRRSTSCSWRTSCTRSDPVSPDDAHPPAAFATRL